MSAFRYREPCAAGNFIAAADDKRLLVEGLGPARCALFEFVTICRDDERPARMHVLPRE
jgi:hypothetical protein